MVASLCAAVVLTPLFFGTLMPVDLQSIGRLLKSGKTQNVIVLAGAGISVSAGIPDFRSPGTGSAHSV